MTNEKLIDKLKKRSYDKNAPIPVENIVYKIQNKTIGCLSSFVTISGLPKQGKSLFITTAIASAYIPEDIFGMKLTFPEGRNRLCYVDTESSDYDYYKVLERMRLQMRLDQLPENFDSFLFREDPHTEILQMIEIYLQQNPECSILVIDGILDLISDFNNVEQSFLLIQWLKRISKVHNLLILCVLHLGKKDGNTLGHIGSYLDRKSQSVLKVQKNKEHKTIDMEAQFLRSADDIETISITHNGYEWIQVHNQTENKHTWSADKIELIDTILNQPKEYRELLNEVTRITGKSVSTAKKLIRSWIENGDIIKQDHLYKTKTGQFLAPNDK